MRRFGLPGPAVVNLRFGDAQLRFIRHTGEAEQQLIGQLCAGRVDPQQGHVVTLST